MWHTRGVFIVIPMSRAVDVWVSRRWSLKFHPNTDLHQRYSFKSLRWKADASQILVLDNSIFSHLSFSLEFQSVLAGRWVLPNWWGAPMLLGIADSTQSRQLYSWASRISTLGHPETLLLGIIRLYTGAVDLLFLMVPLLGRDFMDSLSRSCEFLS